MFKWIFFLVVSSMVLGFPGAAWTQGSAGSSAPAAPPEEKTTITSKRMTVKNQESRAIFEGAVVLTRGPLVVHADVMEVFFQTSDAGNATSPKVPAVCRTTGKKREAVPRVPKSGQANASMPAVSNRSICLMEATGHVVIEKDDGRATSRRAVYQVNDRTIILTGDPVACQRGTRVSGDKITMYLDDDRSEVEGGSQVMINPEGGRCSP